jgi:hypothetical protein
MAAVGPLSGYRVLDLADESAALCGKSSPTSARTS